MKKLCSCYFDICEKFVDLIFCLIDQYGNLFHLIKTLSYDPILSVINLIISCHLFGFIVEYKLR